jgi:hypothetical protein
MGQITKTCYLTLLLLTAIQTGQASAETDLRPDFADPQKRTGTRKAAEQRIHRDRDVILLNMPNLKASRPRKKKALPPKRTQKKNMVVTKTVPLPTIQKHDTVVTVQLLDTGLLKGHPYHPVRIPLFDPFHPLDLLGNNRIDIEHVAPRLHIQHVKTGISFDAGWLLSKDVRRRARDKKLKEEAERLLKNY